MEILRLGDTVKHFYPYTIADILLDTTIDKGVSDLINDASEFVVGNNGISW